jgi:hypothetical protein
MTAADFEKLCPKNNWIPEMKKGGGFILVGCNDIPVPIAHFADDVVYAL